MTNSNNAIHRKKTRRQYIKTHRHYRYSNNKPSTQIVSRKKYKGGMMAADKQPSLVSAPVSAPPSLVSAPVSAQPSAAPYVWGSRPEGTTGTQINPGVRNIYITKAQEKPTQSKQSRLIEAIHKLKASMPRGQEPSSQATGSRQNLPDNAEKKKVKETISSLGNMQTTIEREIRSNDAEASRLAAENLAIKRREFEPLPMEKKREVCQNPTMGLICRGYSFTYNVGDPKEGKTERRRTPDTLVYNSPVMRANTQQEEALLRRNVQLRAQIAILEKGKKEATKLIGNDKLGAAERLIQARDAVDKAQAKLDRLRQAQSTQASASATAEGMGAAAAGAMGSLPDSNTETRWTFWSDRGAAAATAARKHPPPLSDVVPPPLSGVVPPPLSVEDAEIELEAADTVRATVEKEIDKETGREMTIEEAIRIRDEGRTSELASENTSAGIETSVQAELAELEKGSEQAAQAVRAFQDANNEVIDTEKRIADNPEMSLEEATRIRDEARNNLAEAAKPLANLATTGTLDQQEQLTTIWKDLTFTASTLVNSMLGVNEHGYLTADAMNVHRLAYGLKHLTGKNEKMTIISDIMLIAPGLFTSVGLTKAAGAVGTACSMVGLGASTVTAAATTPVATPIGAIASGTIVGPAVTAQCIAAGALLGTAIYTGWNSWSEYIQKQDMVPTVILPTLKNKLQEDLQIKLIDLQKSIEKKYNDQGIKSDLFKTRKKLDKETIANLSPDEKKLYDEAQKIARTISQVEKTMEKANINVEQTSETEHALAGGLIAIDNNMLEATFIDNPTLWAQNEQTNLPEYLNISTMYHKPRRDLINTQISIIMDRLKLNKANLNTFDGKLEKMLEEYHGLAQQHYMRRNVLKGVKTNLKTFRDSVAAIAINKTTGDVIPAFKEPIYEVEFEIDDTGGAWRHVIEPGNTMFGNSLSNWLYGLFDTNTVKTELTRQLKELISESPLLRFFDRKLFDFVNGEEMTDENQINLAIILTNPKLDILIDKAIQVENNAIIKTEEEAKRMAELRTGEFIGVFYSDKKAEQTTQLLDIQIERERQMGNTTAIAAELQVGLLRMLYVNANIVLDYLGLPNDKNSAIYEAIGIVTQAAENDIRQNNDNTSSNDVTSWLSFIIFIITAFLGGEAGIGSLLKYLRSTENVFFITSPILGVTDKILKIIHDLAVQYTFVTDMFHPRFTAVETIREVAVEARTGVIEGNDNSERERIAGLQARLEKIRLWFWIESLKNA